MSKPTSLGEKYTVTKDSQPVENCFVLQPDRDQAARVALLAYADATDDLTLGHDLRLWVQAIQDEISHDQQTALVTAVCERAVASATRKVEASRRELQSNEMELTHAQQMLARIRERSDASNEGEGQ